MWIAIGSEESWKAKNASAFHKMTEPALHNKAGSEFLLPRLVDERLEVYFQKLGIVNPKFVNRKLGMGGSSTNESIVEDATATVPFSRTLRA